MALVKKEWMPNCAMKRVIVHWSAGGHKASNLDKKHYHLMVEDNGNVVLGFHAISDNVSTTDGDYAAHTRGANTGSIGVAMCCMAGARQGGSSGQFPMTRKQYETTALVVAELCQFYQIAISPSTVLGHGEVQANLGKPQLGKWDPMFLPFEPMMSPTQVGNYFRTLVRNAIECGPEQEEPPLEVKVLVRGKPFPGKMLNEEVYVQIRPVVDAFKGEYALPKADADSVCLSVAGQVHEIQSVLLDKRGYVGARDLGGALGLAVDWDGEAGTVTVG